MDPLKMDADYRTWLREVLELKPEDSLPESVCSDCGSAPSWWFELAHGSDYCRDDSVKGGNGGYHKPEIDCDKLAEWFIATGLALNVHDARKLVLECFKACHAD